MRPFALHSAARVLPAIIALLCAQPSRALYGGGPILAYQVADNAFTIDGKPDSLWRTLYARGASTLINLEDFSKMVILQPEGARNDDPAKYVKNPDTGSVAFMAAFDSKALYFFFLVRARAFADPKAFGCAASDSWKTDAAEVYVDPSPWSTDAAIYQSYFTADASGLIYGTSPHTIQVDKPISYHDTGWFYRDRKTADRFQAPATLPTGIKVAASPHTSSDTAWVGVEMKIPFWTTAADFSPGKSMFVSWGYNYFVDSAKTGCAGNPLAYRWAKNVLSYDSLSDKPPGWHPGDSTHYDPLRSWDGWGEMFLRGGITDNRCTSSDPKSVFDANWTPAYWQKNCQGGATTMASPGPVRMDAAGMPLPFRLPARDALGRVGRAPSPAFPRPD